MNNKNIDKTNDKIIDKIENLDKIENPLKDINEEIVSFQRLSFFEKIGMVSSLIITIGLLFISIYSFIIDLRNLNRIIIDIILIFISGTSLYFINNLYRKKIVIETLIDNAFQKGVYNRLEPLVENIAKSHIDAEVILDRMSNIDLKVENILKERSKEMEGITEEEREKETILGKELQIPVMIGTSLIFIVKCIFMIIVTMAIFMFLVNFNLGRLTPIVTLSIFILWWIFLTNEYNLWKDNSAWLFVFIPVTIVPVSVMILGNIVNYNVLMAALYGGIGIYTIIYYIWAVYTTTGVFPFTKTKRIEQGPEKLFSLQQKGMIKDLLSNIKVKK